MQNHYYCDIHELGFTFKNKNLKTYSWKVEMT